MKTIKIIVSSLFVALLVLNSFGANGNCTLALIDYEAMNTEPCECSYSWPQGQDLPGGPTCPAGDLINQFPYQKCVAGSIYSKCENKLKIVGYRWSCTLEYDYAAAAACAIAANACSWQCFWAVLPPTPGQLLVCASCLGLYGLGCKPCDYAKCTTGPMREIKLNAQDGQTESICGA